MSIFECLKDYESKNGKLSKKNPQIQDESVLRKNENIKKLFVHYDNSNEEKSKEESKK